MKLAFVTGEAVGERMAGPAIRYWELAHALANRHEVSLASPVVTRDSQTVRLLELGGLDFARSLRGVDTVITHDPRPSLLARVRHAGCRFVYDAYDPIVLENLLIRDRKPRLQNAVLATTAALTSVGLLNADMVICASERQRDYWLGALSVLGRVDVAQLHDPSLRALVDVVPFGLPPGRPVLSGRAPRFDVGWDETSIVALWGGGVWDWLDGATVVEGLAIARADEPRLRLMFMGTGSPSPGAGGQHSLLAAHAATRELPLARDAVAFAEGWVPYDRRQNFLADADIGVTAHHTHVETRFAFRTRVLDYLWSGLPCLLSEGDVLAELTTRHGAGITIPTGDPQAWANSLLAMCDPGARGRAREAALHLSEEFRWPVIADRLHDILMRHHADPGPSLSAANLVVLTRYLRHALTWSLMDGRLARGRGGSR